MTQQKTNKGCKGHYWTDVQNIEDMEASNSDIIGYENYRLRMDNRFRINNRGVNNG